MAELRYLRMALTEINHMLEKTESGLSSGNECYIRSRNFCVPVCIPGMRTLKYEYTDL